MILCKNLSGLVFNFLIICLIYSKIHSFVYTVLWVLTSALSPVATIIIKIQNSSIAPAGTPLCSLHPSSPTLPEHLPLVPTVWSHLCSSASPRMSLAWNHMIPSLWSLASLTWHKVFMMGNSISHLWLLIWMYQESFILFPTERHLGHFWVLVINPVILINWLFSMGEGKSDIMAMW